MAPDGNTRMMLGELKEFKRATLEELAKIRKQVEELNAFRWKAAGVMASVVFVFEAIGQWIRASGK
jgi:hypothetical protein